MGRDIVGEFNPMGVLGKGAGDGENAPVERYVFGKSVQHGERKMLVFTC